MLNFLSQPLRMEPGPHGDEQFDIHRLFAEHTVLLTECPLLEGHCDNLLITAILPILQMFSIGSEIHLFSLVRLRQVSECMFQKRVSFSSDCFGLAASVNQHKIRPQMAI